MTIFRLPLIALGTFLLFITSAFAEPALFAVSDDDTTIYVFGTVHMLRSDEDWQGPTISEALTASDAIYFEADVYTIDPSVMQGVVLRHGFFRNGEDLSAHLSGEEWQALATYAAQIGLPIDALLPMQPWFAAITLTTVAAMGQGLDPDSGVESHLHEDIAKTDIERRYFETVEQQIRFLSDLPMDIQVQLLNETVAEADSSMDTLDALVAAWREGDLDQLDELANGSMREAFPDLYDAVILRRNQNWAEELTVLMETPGTFFVAVGSAHLPGDEGLLNLLRGEGYAVARQ